MPIIVDPVNFSPNNLTVPDVYLIVLPPQAYIAGVPTAATGFDGTASWGALNTPQLIGNTTDLNNYYGTISAASLTDSHDLATDVVQALNQAGQAGLFCWASRIDDGTSVAAQFTLKDTTSPSAINGGVLAGLFTGILGNQIKCTISEATNTDFVNVLFTAWQGKRQEFYTNLPNDATFWVALKLALLSGQGTTVPPSQLCRFTPASSGSPQAPALGTFTLTGGTDGRSGVDTADLLGTNAGATPTGMYVFNQNLNPAPQILSSTGLTDTTAFASLVTLGAQQGMAVILNLPIGTSVTDAVTALDTAGVSSFQAILPLDWLLIFDAINDVQRFISPSGTIAGRLAVLSPEQSAMNKQVYGVLGTYRVNPTSGQPPYSNADIGDAQINGITLIQNPIPAGPVVGFRTGVNTSAAVNPVTGPIEYTRMTNFIIASVGRVLGQYLGKPLSYSSSDPTMAAIRSALNAFGADLVGNQQLQAYKTICDIDQNGGQNTFQDVAEHKCFVSFNATYMSSVLFLIFQLQGGTTVNLVSAVISGGQPVS